MSLVRLKMLTLIKDTMFVICILISDRHVFFRWYIFFDISPPVQIFISTNHHAAYIATKHPHFSRILLVRKKSHSKSFFPNTDILWSSVSREDATPITTSLTPSLLVLNVMFPTYPHDQLLNSSSFFPTTILFSNARSSMTLRSCSNFPSVA